MKSKAIVGMDEATTRSLIAEIRQLIQGGHNDAALSGLDLLEEVLMTVTASDLARFAQPLRAMRNTGQVRRALDAGTDPTVAAVQAFQKKHDGRAMTAPTIRRALRELNVYKPGRPGAPRKPKK
jgi:hypothetical protein